MQLIDQLFSSQPPPDWTAKLAGISVMGADSGDDLPLVETGGHDQSGEMFHVIAADEEFPGQKPQQVGVRCLAIGPVACL